jgi:major membrane immunogen (membrane-anchored lipoprotein)
MKTWIVLMLALVLLAGGCSLYKNDKCWIDDYSYKKVKELYDKTGSLEMVRQTLKDEFWRRCEINEAIYRLKKEYHLGEQ